MLCLLQRGYSERLPSRAQRRLSQQDVIPTQQSCLLVRPLSSPILASASLLPKIPMTTDMHLLAVTLPAQTLVLVSSLVSVLQNVSQWFPNKSIHLDLRLWPGAGALPACACAALLSSAFFLCASLNASISAHIPPTAPDSLC